MGFPVQELVYVPVPAYFLTGGVESVDQQAAVCIRERRSFVSVPRGGALPLRFVP